MTALERETHQVLTDLSWLTRCHCSQLPVDEFFVATSRVISEEALHVARTCPARREEVIFAYGRDIRVGYFGGVSPGQRRAMTLPEALAYIAEDCGPDAPSAAIAVKRRVHLPPPAATPEADDDAQYTDLIDLLSLTRA